MMSVIQLQEKQDKLIQQKCELLEDYTALLQAFKEQAMALLADIESVNKDICGLDSVIKDACDREEAQSH